MQPYGKPLDLDKSNDAIMAESEAMFRADPAIERGANG